MLRCGIHTHGHDDDMGRTEPYVGISDPMHLKLIWDLSGLLGWLGWLGGAEFIASSTKKQYKSTRKKNNESQFYI